MGSKRSGLNYSFRMSNNACWLLFRVGVGGDPLNNSGPMILFLSLRKKKSGSVVQMFARVSPGCRSPLLLPGWPWPSPQQQCGWNRRWTCIFSLHAGVLQYDCGELAAPCRTSSGDQFTVHHVLRLAGLLLTSERTQENSPAVECYFLFIFFFFTTAHVLVHVARQLLLSRFLVIYMVFIAAGEAKNTD